VLLLLPPVLVVSVLLVLLLLLLALRVVVQTSANEKTRLPLGGRTWAAQRAAISRSSRCAFCRELADGGGGRGGGGGGRGSGGRGWGMRKRRRRRFYAVTHSHPSCAHRDSTRLALLSPCLSPSVSSLSPRLSLLSLCLFFSLFFSPFSLFFSLLSLCLSVPLSLPPLSLFSPCSPRCRRQSRPSCQACRHSHSPSPKTTTTATTPLSKLTSIRGRRCVVRDVIGWLLACTACCWWCCGVVIPFSLCCGRACACVRACV
jgi:hypothetical protein